MAMIYDMVTGKIISEGVETYGATSTDNSPEIGMALQPIDECTPVEDLPPVDAYMVMLQELLKKL